MDLFFWFMFGSIGLLLVIAVVGPPLQYFARVLGHRMDDVFSGYYGTWMWRGYAASARRQYHQAQRSFARWFAARFDEAAGSSISDEELMSAQQLTPMVRQLLEEEVPTSIRRCNAVHRRMARIMHAGHMREIAAEPECLSLRQFTAMLLARTVDVLERYPLSLRLESEELLDA